MVKLNHRQRVALGVLQSWGEDWSDAGNLSDALWRIAHTQKDEAEIRKIHNARGYSGYGRTLSWVAKQGWAERRWSDYMAHWEYRITDEGRRVAAELGIEFA